MRSEELALLISRVIVLTMMAGEQVTQTGRHDPRRGSPVMLVYFWVTGARELSLK